MIAFRLDEDSAVAPYLQLVNQVRNAVLLGRLVEGDRLPTIKAMASTLSINPNTVIKAYRELDYSGLITTRSGVGTFISVTLADDTARATHAALGEELTRWLIAARRAGMSADAIQAMLTTASDES